MIDDLTALRLQLDWGADEAVVDAPADRYARLPPVDAASSPAAASAAGSRATIMPVLGIAARAQQAASDAADLGAVRTALETFDGCGLRDTAGSFVFADGPENAPLLVVVEAPDAADDQSGRPLSGEAGRYFDRMLQAAGIERAACRVATLVPWRPPGGRPPNVGEVAACAPFLQRHLALLAAEHAILLGATVARALGGGAGTIRQLRGRWQTVSVVGRARPIQAMVMVPPAQIVTDAKSKQNSWSDLLLLRKETGTISSR